MTIEIISGSTCPFAHRTRLVLMEKTVPYELTEIDLNDKPEWFLELSPYEKVPVLRHGDLVVFESAIVNEYLEEVFPDPPLMPQSPAARAQVRMWVDFANNRFIPPIYRLLMAQAPEDQARQAGRLNEALRHMEQRGLQGDGDATWFGGDRLSLADLSFYPHLERFSAVAHYRGFRLGREFPRLHAWLERMADLPSVQALRAPHAAYVEAWSKYAFNTSTGATARDLREA
jgi:glutathione S-transferase